MAEAPDEITEILRATQRAEPVVREFAWVWLEAFRRDAADLLLQQRREGRAAALRGDDVEAVSRKTEERLEAARARLLGRLQRLLQWARETGRSGE